MCVCVCVRVFYTFGLITYGLDQIWSVLSVFQCFVITVNVGHNIFNLEEARWRFYYSSINIIILCKTKINFVINLQCILKLIKMEIIVFFFFFFFTQHQRPDVCSWYAVKTWSSIFGVWDINNSKTDLTKPLLLTVSKTMLKNDHRW